MIAYSYIRPKRVNTYPSYCPHLLRMPCVELCIRTPAISFGGDSERCRSVFRGMLLDGNIKTYRSNVGLAEEVGCCF